MVVQMCSKGVALDLGVPQSVEVGSGPKDRQLVAPSREGGEFHPLE